MSLIARNSSDFRANFSLSRSRMLTARRKIFENGGLCDVSRLPSLVDTPAPTIAYQPFLKRGAATKRVLVQCEEPFASADGVAHLADQVRCRIGRWRRPILCGVNRLSLRSGAPSVAITLFIVGLRLRLQLTSPRFIAARIALTSSLGFLFRAAFPAAPLRLMEARVERPRISNSRRIWVAAGAQEVRSTGCSTNEGVPCQGAGRARPRRL